MSTKALYLIPLIASAQIPMPSPSVETYPTWVNLPPMSTSAWITSGNAPWDDYLGEYVTQFGPSAISPTPLPGFTLSSVWTDPPEFKQSGTNVFCNLSFWFQYWPQGSSSASVRLNGTPRYSIPPAATWTRFSTNLNVSTISKLEFAIYNGASQQSTGVLIIDAVGITPLWTPVQFDFELIKGSPNTLRWSATKYDATWKLWGQTNVAKPFLAITGTPTIANGYWSQASPFGGTNELFQLRKP